MLAFALIINLKPGQVLNCNLYVKHNKKVVFQDLTLVYVY